MTKALNIGLILIQVLFNSFKKAFHQILSPSPMKIFLLILSIESLLCFFLWDPEKEQSRRKAPLNDWESNASNSITDYMDLYSNTTLMEPEEVCSQPIFLLIMVISALENFAQRDAIRQSWARPQLLEYPVFYKIHQYQENLYLKPLEKRIKYFKKYFHENNITKRPLNIMPRVKVLFMLGKNKANDSLTSFNLRNELNSFNDLVQEDFVDSYNNLTLKMIFSMKWLKNRCQTAFVMKTDDDSFVNVPNLLHLLLGGTIPKYQLWRSQPDRFNPKNPAHRFDRVNNILMGHLFVGTKPISETYKRFYMPYYMYPKKFYPPYLSGSGYLMSSDVLTRLYEKALVIPFLYLEDIYVTGILAAKAGIKHLHNPLFCIEYSTASCVFKAILTQHHLSSEKMVENANFLMDFENSCLTY